MNEFVQVMRMEKFTRDTWVKEALIFQIEAFQAQESTAIFDVDAFQYNIHKYDKMIKLTNNRNYHIYSEHSDQGPRL